MRGAQAVLAGVGGRADDPRFFVRRTVKGLTAGQQLEEDILAEFLTQNRAEAKQVSIYEYDEEKHMRQEREASWEEGWEEGRLSGIKEGEERGKLSGRRELLKELIQKKLLKKMSVSEIAEELEEDEKLISELIQELE